MKLFRLLPIFLTIGFIQAETATEMALLDRLHALLEKDGTIYFSNLYSDPDLSAEQKEFLERLYEIFFNLPGFLKAEFEATGSIPSRQQIASSFGLALPSVDLLLEVAESDLRISQLFETDPESGEITRLRTSNIDYFIQSQGTSTPFAGWAGRPLPDFDLPTLAGGRLNRQDLAGSSLLIYFWFTGCPPCTRIGPNLARLSQRYADKGFQVIGFNSDQVVGLTLTEAQRSDYMKRHGLTFTSLHVDQKTRRAFGNVNVFPTLFFVSDDGQVAARMINYQDWETLDGTVRDLLGLE